jgi:hypothetical protein
VAKVVFAAWIFATWPLPPATWIAVGKCFADCNPAFADSGSVCTHAKVVMKIQFKKHMKMANFMCICARRQNSWNFVFQCICT